MSSIDSDRNLHGSKIQKGRRDDASSDIVEIKSDTDKLMLRIALVIMTLGALFGIYSFGRPLWWKFYATVIHPFEDLDLGGIGLALDDDPFSAGIHDKQTNAKGPRLDAERKAIEVKNPVALVQPPFDINNFPLTKDRVNGLLQDGYIMVTWANHHYLDFAKSWVYHVKKIGVTGYLVGAMDDDMLKALAESGVNTWRMNSGITKNDLGWGSSNFHKMGRVKISLIQQFLQLNVTVVISDIDTAWLRNPIPYFSRYPEADILTSTDQLGETVPDESLEIFPKAGSAFNIGIMMFRTKSMDFVNDWIKKLGDPQMWDQSAFNDLARLGHTHSDPNNKNLFKGDQGKLTMGVLPASIFASGHMFFTQKKYQELGLKPYVAHATFQYSGTPGKRNRFREALLWDDPPDYFDHPKGFIYINIAIPQSLLDLAKAMTGPMKIDKIANHFNLVQYQFFRLRVALALATVTGRVVIMPPIWCQLDKYWAPLYDGNIPGSHWKKPFICPMDHVLDIEGWWHRKLEVPQFGPHIEFREYSFLQNPRLTQAVNKSRLVLEPCTGGTCPGGAKVTDVQNGKIGISSGADITRLKEVLTSPQASAFKILELQSEALETLFNVWSTFPEPDKDRFMTRLKHQTSTLCCLETNPGWVWYDFFADIAHKDRFGRPFNQTFVYYRGDSREFWAP